MLHLGSIFIFSQHVDTSRQNIEYKRRGDPILGDIEPVAWAVAVAEGGPGGSSDLAWRPPRSLPTLLANRLLTTANLPSPASSF